MVRQEKQNKIRIGNLLMVQEAYYDLQKDKEIQYAQISFGFSLA